jgi:hypothetical protein
VNVGKFGPTAGIGDMTVATGITIIDRGIAGNAKKSSNLFFGLSHCRDKWDGPFFLVTPKYFFRSTLFSPVDLPQLAR